MRHFLIVGLGHLGRPLASNLLQMGHAVTAISRQKKSVINISEITHDLTADDFPHFNTNHRYSVIFLLPHLDNYLTLAENFLQHCPSAIIESILISSSTSIYSSLSGAVDESSQIPTKEASIVYKSELFWKNFAAEKKIPLTIVRLGGLYGEDRHPIYYLSGKTGVEKPYAPVNLIAHQTAAKLMALLLQKQISGKATDPLKIFNLVDDEHPTRIDYYQRMASILSLPLPQFNMEDKRVGYFVSNQLIKDYLNLTKGIQKIF